ncbi:MAG: class B sortase [Clostridium sp.]|nr:class B sortase [Clostridium sp.]
MKKKTVINIIMVLCLLVAFGCGAYLLYYYYRTSKSEGAVEDLKQMIDWENEETEDRRNNPEMVMVEGVMVQKKFAELYRTNQDFVGWLTIEDTDVDYPVMYTPGEAERGEYYIHRNFDEEYSADGLPFVDANCRVDNPTDNLIIYGHNMRSGKMFHDILQYDDTDFYRQHKTFSFDTIYEDGTYEVVAAFYGQIFEEPSTEFKYYEFVNAGSEEEFQDYVANIKKMSVIDTGVEVQYGDKLITLSTCAYHVKNGRFAVIAKKKN